jgi:putative membrane protein
VSVLTNPANWPIEPPLVGIVLAGMLYWLGLRRRPLARRDVEARWRAASFYAGLFALFVALDSPVAAYDNRLFSVHMTQHVLLMMVAPPLIVLGRPWLPVWQPLPLGFRRSAAKQVVRGGWAAPLRGAGRCLAQPLAAWLALTVTLVVWHLPVLYDATVRNADIHDLEHALFFLTALLFWCQLIDSPPFHARLDHFRRAAYATGALAVGWVLSIVLALSHSALYGAYAGLSGRPGGISALADQQLGAGVLWVPGSVALLVAACVNFYLWLEPEAGRRQRRVAGQY